MNSFSNSMLRLQGGFTLIELVIVVAIVGIPAAARDWGRASQNNLTSTARSLPPLVPGSLPAGYAPGEYR